MEVQGKFGKNGVSHFLQPRVERRKRICLEECRSEAQFPGLEEFQNQNKNFVLQERKKNRKLPLYFAMSSPKLTFSLVLHKVPSRLAGTSNFESPLELSTVLLESHTLNCKFSTKYSSTIFFKMIQQLNTHVKAVLMAISTK